ncbi:MAG: twin-arginine translocase TatA/TatE family subunit [Saprospiraceae bacterium]
MQPLFLFGLGVQEMFFVFMAVLLLFGGKKIPELMRGLGKGIREFNTARASIEGEIRDGMRDEDIKEKAKIKVEKEG